MSRDLFADVGAFHRKFGLPHTDDEHLPCLLPEDVWEFRLKFLREELQETIDAHAEGDLAKFFDGLMDLVYVALGTAHMAHLPWAEGWDEVQRANMAKERSSGAGDERSSRGHTLDVVKPAGWTPPDVEGVLARYRQRVANAIVELECAS